MGILLEEPETQVDREVRQEEPAVIDQPITSIPQRIRCMPARLQDCVIASDDVVDNRGELIHCALYADVEPVNAAEALKDDL